MIMPCMKKVSIDHSFRVNSAKISKVRNINFSLRQLLARQRPVQSDMAAKVPLPDPGDADHIKKPCQYATGASDDKADKALSFA